MVGMAAIVWWPAFTLGAWQEIFFDDILALWAASTAAFVFVLVERRPVGGRLVRAMLLLLPSLWLFLNFVVEDETTDLAVAILDLVALAAVLVGIPFTLWVLVRIVWPDFAGETRRRTKWLIAVVVLGVAVGALFLGLNQAHFLTCEDFAISGNSEPPGLHPRAEPSRAFADAGLYFPLGRIRCARRRCAQVHQMNGTKGSIPTVPALAASTPKCTETDANASETASSVTSPSHQRQSSAGVLGSWAVICSTPLCRFQSRRS
jgi:hypothetical protein